MKYLQVGTTSSYKRAELLKQQNPNTPLILIYINSAKMNPSYSIHEDKYHRKVLDAISNGSINNVKLDSICIYQSRQHKIAHLSKLAAREFEKCGGNLWSILHETDPIRYVCMREFSLNNGVIIHLNMQLDHQNDNIALIASVNLRQSCVEYYNAKRINQNLK